MTAKPCRHRHTWDYSIHPYGGPSYVVQWCYQCGAIRKNDLTIPREISKWTKPVGPGGENPAMRRTVKKEAAK
jgi:hypothetical protein